jgi:hypothetical protein
MKTVLSYCSARMFLKGLLPMVAMSPRHSEGALNDNDPQRHVGIIIKPFQQREALPLHSKRAACKPTGPLLQR